MALKKLIYPFDLSGSLTSNRVEENHVLGTSEYRTIALKNGPLFTEGLTVRERNSTTLLSRGTDYELVFYYNELAVLTAGKEVCGVIVVHNTDVSTDVVVGANIVGGPFANSGQVIEDAITALEEANKNVYWKNIIDKPDLFQPTPHLHDFGDIYGFEFLIDVLGNIRDTLLIGSNAQFEQISERISSMYDTLNNSITDHASDKTNVHKVTADQVNAYDKEHIDAYKQTVNGQFSALEPRVTTILQSIAANTGKFDSLTDAMTGLSESAAASSNSVARVQRLIAEVNVSLSEIYDQMSIISNTLTSLRQRDTELTAAINANINAINVEKDRNDTQDNSISNLASKDTEQDVELARLKQVDTTLENATTELTERVRLEENAGNNRGTVINSHTQSLSTLQELISKLTTRVAAIETDKGKFFTGTSSISGLTGGKKYVVHIYGVTTNRGGDTRTLAPVTVTNSSGSVLATTAGGNINWHDGSAPHTATLVITAPSDGKIYGQTDVGDSWNLLAYPL